MSQKKSKSKDKAADKPPKAKKQKGDDAKSKKSADKQSKKPKSPVKKDDSKLSKSKVSKTQNDEKNLMDESQDISIYKNVLAQHMFGLDQSLCQYHKQKNSMFCEICEQPGCKQCLVYGPHNNQMHRITKIDEAFKGRYLYLNDVVCGDLIERRDRLNKRMGELTVLGDQLRFSKNGIQKITKIEYNQMLQRLRTSSGGKFAVLHHEMSQLQKDLQSLNCLAFEFKDLTSMDPESGSFPPNNPPKGMVSFLLRYKYLQEQAQQLISKPIKTSVDVYPYDLPRELTEKKMILEKNKKWVQVLQIKDEAVWNLVQEKKSLQKRLWAQFQFYISTQYQEWSRMKENYTSQLQGYAMCCQKCQIPLDSEIINDVCSGNGYHEFG